MKSIHNPSSSKMSISFNLFPFFIFNLVLIVHGQNGTFKNPILDHNSADPAMLKLGSYYYLTLSENRESQIAIFKSDKLTDFRSAEKKTIFIAPEGYHDAWASELHILDGQIYLYFTMAGPENQDHRMYALKALEPMNPMGNWSEAIRLMDDWNYAAIDGTIMTHGNGQRYFLFTTWSFGPMGIFIAPLLEPTRIGFPKIEIKKPELDYECQGGCVNEGPYFIYRNNISYCVYSVSSTWDPNYALAMMSIPYDKDPMTITDWKMATGPVFWNNPSDGVYTTGHAAFTTSPDDTETWMVYHGTVNTTHIDGFRIARVEKITWDDQGPVFPRPHGFNTPQPVPSGQI